MTGEEQPGTHEARSSDDVYSAVKSLAQVRRAFGQWDHLLALSLDTSIARIVEVFGDDDWRETLRRLPR